MTTGGNLRSTRDDGNIERDGSFKLRGPGPHVRRQLELDRNIVRVVPMLDPPPRPQPLPVGQYTAGETAIMNLMLRRAPYDTANVENSRGDEGGSRTVQAAAWAAIYLYAVIAEDKRGPSMIAAARVKLRELADYIVSQDPFLVSPSIFDRTSAGGDFYVEDFAASGIACLRAYQIFGTGAYLDFATRRATDMRVLQCGDLRISKPSSTDSAGASVKHWGMWSHRFWWTGAVYDFDHRYYPSDLIGVTFLALYKDIAGDVSIGPTSSVFINGSAAALVSVAIAEALAFWEDGAYDVVRAATVVGFSTSTPFEFFDSYPADKGVFTGDGRWKYRGLESTSSSAAYTTGTISAHSWAMGLHALYLRDGASAFVAGVFDWMADCAALAAFDQDPLTTAKRTIYRNTLGEFDAELAPPTAITVLSSSAAANVAATSFYDLAAAGLLAPLFSARQQAKFRELKDAIDVARPKYQDGGDRDGEVLFLGRMGRCGLTWQPFSATDVREESVAFAAQVGHLYREQPQAWELTT